MVESKSDDSDWILLDNLCITLYYCIAVKHRTIMNELSV